MTRVCLLGSPDVELRYELQTHETSREALATYDLSQPFENTVALETVSLGAAVSLLNDLNWYLVRFVDEAFVLEPSVSETEWLSRTLARAIRDDEIAPDASDRYLKVYGVVEPEGRDRENEATVGTAERTDSIEVTTGVTDTESATDDLGDTTRPRLVEPMYVARTGRDLPAYDLRSVDDTLVLRVSEAEFGA